MNIGQNGDGSKICLMKEIGIRMFLFSEVLTFEKAKEFRNNYKPHQVVYATW